MKSIQRSIGVAFTLVVATLSVWGQTYGGVTIGSTLVGASRSDVSAYGEPSRMVYGLRFVMPARRGMELAATLGYRLEDGGFVSSFTRGAVRPPSGRINVVENPTAGPLVVSSLTTTAAELNVALRIPVARMDSSGSYAGVQLGVLTDYLLSAEQVDDYTGILPGDRGQIPDRVSTSYNAQVGGGAILGGIMVLNTGIGRLVIDVAYLLRQPETVAVPTPRLGGPKEQYVGWLVGSGLRFSAGFEVPL
ncbi:MAG: hypothetical protein FGM32_07910 [Candidatus Kapabacteria bacterium]|nr:hypothetical protein [Candidatus Kapabacteria bacterium]